MRSFVQIIAVVALSVIVSGCTERGVSFLEPDPAFPPADEGKTVDTFRSQNLPSSGDQRTLPAAIDDFVESAVDARESSAFDFPPAGSSGTKPERITIFVERGIALSNQLCIAWFEALRAEQRKIDNYQGVFVTAASGLTTMFGILNLSTDLLTGAAAGTTAGNALFDNYRAAFLFSPDLILIKEKVDELRTQSVTQLTQTNFESYEQARDALLSHDAICSGQTVERIINDSARISEFKFDPPGGPSGEDMKEVGALAKDIAGLIGLPVVKDLTTTQLNQLYTVYFYFAGLSDEQIKGFLKESLISDLYKKIEADRKISGTADNFKEIISKLQRIGNILNLQADAEQARLDFEKKEALEEEKKKAEAAKKEAEDAQKKAEAAKTKAARAKEMAVAAEIKAKNAVDTAAVARRSADEAGDDALVAAMNVASEAETSASVLAEAAANAAAKAAEEKAQADALTAMAEAARPKGEAAAAAIVEAESKIKVQDAVISDTFGTFDIERRAPGYSFGFDVVPGEK